MDILVIKIGALGDVVRCSFLAQALRDKYKKRKPRIYWLTSDQAKYFFINNPYIDQIVLEKNRGRLEKMSFDLVVNLEEDVENARFATSLRPKKLIGAFLNRDGKVDYTDDSRNWYDMSMISKLGKKKADIMKRLGKKTHRELMAEVIKVDYRKFEPFLRLTPLQRKMTDQFLRRHNLSRTDLIVGINTGGADRWPKALPIKKTVALIDEIYKRYNATILLFGGLNEVERNKEIIKLSKVPIISTGCGNDLVEFPALVSICNLFIVSDSLGLHIALALKRKTICLIGTTLPNELGTYGIGERVVAKSKDVGFLKKDSKAMEKIDLKEIYKAVENLLSKKITLIITAFKEPSIDKAIESALNQKTNFDYKILVSAPDKETLDVARKYAGRDKRVEIFEDPGKGKMFALNLLFDKIKSDILVLTDGDVYISDDTIEEIGNLFLDPGVGCVAGRPVPVESKKTMYGYWANFLFDSAHKMRKESFEKNDFIECSGYLFAVRNNKVRKIPLDTAEDAIIPYDFWERGYKIGYAENARVFVRNVDNWRDWIKQKVRTSKAHETLDKYADTKTTPRAKTFSAEAKGLSNLFNYARNIKELYWSNLLAIARVYMWMQVFYNSKIIKFKSVDNWERIESAR